IELELGERLHGQRPLLDRAVGVEVLGGRRALGAPRADQRRRHVQSHAGHHQQCSYVDHYLMSNSLMSNSPIGIALVPFQLVVPNYSEPRSSSPVFFRRRCALHAHGTGRAIRFSRSVIWHVECNASEPPRLGANSWNGTSWTIDRSPAWVGHPSGTYRSPPCARSSPARAESTPRTYRPCAAH